MLRAVDQWCADYEEKIRAMGGIGFVMGGIGPDGHIAFNCQGCAHHSTTRLDELNYMSQAAAAGDLGGIEVVRKRKVVTIGLGPSPTTRSAWRSSAPQARPRRRSSRRRWR